MWRDSVADIATRYGLHSPGIESRWGQHFLNLSHRTWSGRDVALNTEPHLARKLKKEFSYTSTPRLGLHGLL